MNNNKDEIDDEIILIEETIVNYKYIVGFILIKGGVIK